MRGEGRGARGEGRGVRGEGDRCMAPHRRVEGRGWGWGSRAGIRRRMERVGPQSVGVGGLRLERCGCGSRFGVGGLGNEDEWSLLRACAVVAQGEGS